METSQPGGGVDGGGGNGERMRWCIRRVILIDHRLSNGGLPTRSDGK